MTSRCNFMTTIQAHTFDELAEAAKFEADKGAMLYAAQVLMRSSETIPATAFAQAHGLARKEWLDGYFDATGKCRFPAELFKAPAPAEKPKGEFDGPEYPVGGPNDGAN